MSSSDLSTAPRLAPALGRAMVIAIALAGGLITLLGGGWSYLAQGLAATHPHAPRWELIAQAPVAIQIHLITVSAAFVLATVQIAGPKGRLMHRTLGWILAVLLVVTAIASLFIHNPGGGLFNPFQIFSVWTLVAIPLAIVAARRHNVKRHGSMMIGFYAGALVIAGLLTFMPGRLLWRVFFG